ncbi:MAG: GNAT family N-acetyltransferase [Candidatus Gracilibacteria bacterium]
MQIIPALASHAKEMHRIHTSAVREACKECYSDEQIEAWLSGRTAGGYLEGINNGEMYTVKDDGEVVGFGHAIPGEVVAVFVDPAFHKKGAGKLLLDYGVKIASKNHKKVNVESTLNAEGFYEKYGFKKIKDVVVTKNGIELPMIVLERLVA